MNMFYRRYGKRLLDLGVTLTFLALFWWVFPLVALLVRVRLGSPVLFSQARPGRAGKLFTLYKFRSMSDELDPDGKLRPDEERLPAFGRFLRASSLDELPELYNVLRGEMSLVGPRPLLPVYLDWYSARENRRHELPPGITGLAQVRGRNDLEWDEKLALDIVYVEECSLALDLSILWETVATVLRREGVAKTGHATTETFIEFCRRHDRTRRMD